MANADLIFDGYSTQLLIGQIEGDGVGFEEIFPVGGFKGRDFAHGEFG